MTKKELNEIKSAAFEKFAEQHDDFCPGNTMVYCYRVQEGREVKLLLLTAKTQMNSNTLAENGFTDDAVARLLFTVNRKTKTLTPNGSWDE